MQISIYNASRVWTHLCQALTFATLILLTNVNLQAQTTSTCRAYAGDLFAAQLCTQPGQTILKAVPKGNATIPPNYKVAYVLTKGNQLVVQQVASQSIFTLPDSVKGLYTIHTLIYNAATLKLDSIRIGETTGFDLNALLLQGGGSICAALDVFGVKFSIGTCEDACLAAAGKLLFSSSSCFKDGKAAITAKVQVAPIVPPGYTRLYVLTSGENLVIEAVSTTPAFAADTLGRFTIHTLVYDSTTLKLDSIEFGETTGAELNALLVQGGGNICAALDVLGAPFTVTACPPVCTAKAGTLKVESSPCITNGKATLKATVWQSPSVPQSYQVRYLLTAGSSLIIQQINTTPSFVVNSAGLYTIHTLVYNPNTLNLSTIQLGTTTAKSVNELLVQGGGSICAALDMAGAVFQAKDCPCFAKAGELRIEGYPYPCLENGRQTLRAKIWVNLTVPQGFQARYVLTSGDSLVIEQIGTAPSFIVDSIGRFTIHTLVYDPNTLNLNTIQLGITTGLQVNKLFLSGGGTLCGAFGLQGASFLVKNCTPTCGGQAGNLKESGNPCIKAGQAILKPIATEAPTVPSGYLVRYVLTSGENLLVEALDTTSTFAVTKAGVFTIHTLVYDPLTFDLNTILIGGTTGYNLHERLTQGGGSLCGAFELYGASYYIIYCQIICDAKAGKFSPDNMPCLQGDAAVLKAKSTLTPTVPTGFAVHYLLTSGNNFVLRGISKTPTFTVNTKERFTIHTIVYDSTTLDLDTLQIGQITTRQLNTGLVQGGGELCAALDMTGARFDIDDCNVECSASTGDLFAYALSPCLYSGKSKLTASHPNLPSVPPGYKTVYILTSGQQLLVEGLNSEPTFEVARAGRFAIHTLVYNPNKLDLSELQIGLTTALDVYRLTIAGGGTLCAAIDPTGLGFQVRSCTNGNLNNTTAAYPNPTANVINLEFRTPERVNDITVEMVDLAGNTVKTWKFDGDATRAELDIREFASGLYNVRIVYDNQSIQNIRVAKTTY